jgi:hypothetical protein
MADEDVLLKLKIELDDAGVEQQAEQAAHKVGQAFQRSANEGIRNTAIFKGFSQGDLDKISQNMASSVGTAFTRFNYPAHIKKQFEDAPLDLGSAFGMRLKNQFREAAQQGLSDIQTAAASRQQDYGSRAQPYLAGIEALTTLLRGQGIAAAVATAVKPLVEQQTRRERESERERRGPAPSGPVFFPPGGGGLSRPETSEERIQRRLQSIPGVVPGAGAAEGEIGALLRGIIGRGAAGGAAGSLIGAGTGGAIGGALGGFGGFVGGVAIQKLSEGVLELGRHFQEMGEQAAASLKQIDSLSSSLGISNTRLEITKRQAAGVGVDFQSMQFALARLAVRAQHDLPDINKEVKDNANTMETAAIKTRESHRAVEKAADDRKEAGERVTKAEAELAKVEAIGAQQRDQQAREAALRVSGAGLALQGAQQRLAQARIAQQFAPEQQAIQNITGPLSVEGAKLGATGAGISAEEARARFAKFKYGEEEPEEDVRERRERMEQLRLDTAEHNEKQAAIRVREAEMAERQRKEERDAGLGPEGQANLRAAEAEHAKQQAELSAEQAKTAQIALKYDQDGTSLAAEINAARRALAQAVRAQATANENTAKIEEERAKTEQEELKYRQPGEIIKGLQGQQGPGYQFGRIQGEDLQKALISMSGGRIGVPGVQGTFMDLLAQFFAPGGAGAGTDTQRQLAQLRGALPAMRGMMGLEQQEDLLKFLKLTPAEREKIVPPAELQKIIDEMEKVEAKRSQAEDLRVQQAKEAADIDWSKIKAGVEAFPAASEMSAFGTALNKATTAAEGFAAKIVGGELQQMRPNPEAEARARGEQPKSEQPTPAPTPPKPLTPSFRVPPPTESPSTPTEGPENENIPDRRSRAGTGRLKLPREEAGGDAFKDLTTATEANTRATEANTDALRKGGGAGAGAGAPGAPTPDQHAAAAAAAAGTPAVAAAAASAAAAAAPGRVRIGGIGETVTPEAQPKPSMGFRQVAGFATAAEAAQRAAAAERAPPLTKLTTGQPPEMRLPVPDWYKTSKAYPTFIGPDGRPTMTPMPSELVNTPLPKRGQDELPNIITGRGTPQPYPGGVFPYKSGGPENLLPGGEQSRAPSLQSAAQKLEQAATKLGTAADKTNTTADKTQSTFATIDRSGGGDSQQSAESADNIAKAGESAKTAADDFSQLGKSVDEFIGHLQAAATPAPMASGGLVGGYGGIDTNLIRATRGEFVVTRSGSNLGDAIRYFTKGYAEGGLVGGFIDAIGSIPGYASGGIVVGGGGLGGGGGRPIELHIGGEKIVGLTATEDAASAISRVAVDRAVRSGYSGASKSSWYRGN